MTDSTTSFVAILFGLGVFAVIVAVGWRSVQNRRILRFQGADGQETVIIAGEDDMVTSVATETETVHAVQPDTAPVASNAEVEEAGRDRLDRVVSSTK